MDKTEIFAQILLLIGEAIDLETGSDEEYKLETELKIEEIQSLLKIALELDSDFHL